MAGKGVVWRLVLVILVSVGCGLLWYGKGVDLGLDLKGGAEILYKVHVDQARTKTSDVMGTTMEVISRRINKFNVSEPRIERIGADEILVQIPGKGEAEIERIKAILKKTGMLTFHLVASESMMKRYKDKTPPPGWVWMEKRAGKNETGEKLLIHKEPDFLGDNITSVELVPWQTGVDWAVKLKLSRASRAKFAKLTREHKGERLAIVLDGAPDGTLYSAPVIRDEIRTNPYITGNFTHEEAQDLARILESGRLPAPISEQYESIVGPSLGQDSIRSGMTAIVIGTGVVVLFMAIYYLGAGLVADMALMLNLVILMGILSWLDATLTLPGMAGIVLLIGMSVDANVLVFERIREELQAGNPLSTAIRNGYARAFITIFDANITTLFTAVILFWVGTGAVKGFAVTLGIGLVASMFTALFATRAVFDMLNLSGMLKKFRMLRLIGRTNFSFSKYWKFSVTLSAVCILLGLGLYFQKGTRMYDIDFLGGVLMNVKLASPTPIDEVREKITSLGGALEEAQIQSVWAPGEKITTLGKSRQFEVRIPLKTKLKGEQFLKNIKMQLRSVFGSSLAPEAVQVTVEKSEKATKGEYAGGTVLALSFDREVDLGRVESILRKVLGDDKLKLKGREEDKDKTLCKKAALITKVADASYVEKVLKEELSSGPFPRVRFVSASMARRMVWRAVWAMLLAMVVIIVYMAFRFQLQYGIGAVVALLHDVLFTMGALAVAGVHVNLPIVAAFLTIVGYSLNDTIVVFDRIRENLRKRKKNDTTPLQHIVDASVNQTLSRTLLTSLTTLLAAAALFVWGGGIIHDFAYALIVGVLVGTYSSIFIASPTAVLLQGEPRREEAKKKK